jgi:hypothetical protein
LLLVICCLLFAVCLLRVACCCCYCCSHQLVHQQIQSLLQFQSRPVNSGRSLCFSSDSWCCFQCHSRPPRSIQLAVRGPRMALEATPRIRRETKAPPGVYRPRLEL